MNFHDYRQFTQARIALGHCGPALPTKAWLDFAYDHACAVDAIKHPWNLKELCTNFHLKDIKKQILHTQVPNREIYLLRPDLGRRLNIESKEFLHCLGKSSAESILIMASNGLSSLAVKNHLEKFLQILLHNFNFEGFEIAYNCIFLIENGRVGLIDDLGDIAKPRMGLVLIGERPGLSAFDSLAVYLTYQPQIGRTDADRNCISNVRPPHGLSYEEAAAKVVFFIKESIRKKLSGTALKEESTITQRSAPFLSNN